MSSLVNAADVLRLIARLRTDITVTDAANHLGLPKSSSSRTLSMMAELGFLERDSVTRAYRPGPVVMEASYHFRASQTMLALAEAMLHRLVDEVGYTGYISVLDGSDSVVIHMRTGSGSLQVYTPPGSRAPAYASAIGRAILSRLPDAQVLALFGDRFEQTHGSAPRSGPQLLQRLAENRERGWALSRGEFLGNVAGVATALQDTSSRQVYGVGLAMPVQEMSESLFTRLGERLAAATREVGRQAGDADWFAVAPQGAQS